MSYKPIKLNCDLGEELYDGTVSSSVNHTGASRQTIDSCVMPYIDMANIACGGHAGDRQSMSQTVRLALSHSVSIGAHPSYPDRENFGRTSLNLPFKTLVESLYHQVAELMSVCSEQGTAVNYIKPHGALYHDCIQKDSVLDCVLQIAQQTALPLMLLSLPKTHPRLDAIQQHAQKYAVPLIEESFADRFYDDNGQLLSRSYPNAVHNDLITISNQAATLINKQGVSSVNDAWLDISCDSLCVHGDTPLAFDALKAIRKMLDNRN